MNVENMYDAWDNGDRHEIRQQFARREEIIKLLQRDGAWDYFDLEGDSVGILMFVTLCQDVAAAEREACAKPRREWVGLTEVDYSTINQCCSTKIEAAYLAETILKEKNA